MWSQLLSSIAPMLWEGGMVGTCPPRGHSRRSRGAGEVEGVQGARQVPSWPHHFLAMGLAESLLRSEPQSPHL